MDISFETKDVRIDPYNSTYIHVDAGITDGDAYDLAKDILYSLTSNDRQDLMGEFEEDIRRMGFIKQE